MAMYTGYPFHSRHRGIGISDVYHSHPACQVASSIALEYRLPGNPLGWPECSYCAVHFAPRSTIRPVHTLRIASSLDLDSSDEVSPT
ncbi:hypothetical protein [Hymenobacter sp. YC55]|uniref:hypothetical protein n=1 Tax=Hymenobacter sp. YC55 TaxID=3034019 RepID=UPI0023F920AF|nr:hypothetical protein [Hymenobacter sp. YC55]MDF7814906.1 hypothetical protein [Hymenobacter sp. YC55]